MNMEQNVRGEAVSLKSRLCEKRVMREISSDYLIPDTQPEARRILVLTERLLPPAKYVGASGVECNGVVDYRIVYLGADGGLWGVCFSSEYELEAPMDIRCADSMGDASATVKVFCEGSTARVSAGRRLYVKSRIGADVSCYGAVGELTGAADCEEDGIERLVSSVSCADFLCASSDVLELSDEIGGFSQESRVISADASAYVSDVRRGEDSLLATGDVTVKLLVCRDGNTVDSVTRKIPFEGVVELERAVGGASFTVGCSVTDIAVNLSEGKAGLSVSAILTAYTAENIEMPYLADAYSVERVCECERSEHILPVCGVLSSGNFSQSERLPLSETDIPEGARFIEIFPKVIFDRCEYSGRYELTGKGRYLILWEKDGEYGVSEIEFPVRYETDGKEVSAPVYSYGGGVISCRCRIDGELLCIDSELSAELCAVGSERVEAVSDITLGEELIREKNRMVVYFPAESETPWEVAKKYHVRADSLSAEKNYYMF